MITASQARHAAYLSAFTTLTSLACFASSSTMSLGPSRGQSVNELRLAEMRPVLWRMGTAADLVRTLRPGMLIPRDASAVNAVSARRWADERAVHVYVDGVLLGGIDVLDRVPAHAVLHVRHLTPTEAMTHFGSGNSSGVIAVTTYANHPVRR